MKPVLCLRRRSVTGYTAVGSSKRRFTRTLSTPNIGLIRSCTRKRVILGILSGKMDPFDAFPGRILYLNQFQASFEPLLGLVEAIKVDRGRRTSMQKSIGPRRDLVRALVHRSALHVTLVRAVRV